MPTLRDSLLTKLYSEKSDVIYTPEERQVILKAEMLKMAEVTKIYSLTVLLDVTEGTISNDLQQIEPWFAQYDLCIVRRPGLGILLEGNEMAKRKAIVNLIYEHFHFVDLFDLMTQSRQKKLNISEFKKYINHSILDLLHLESLTYIKDLITLLEKNSHIFLLTMPISPCLFALALLYKEKDFGKTIS